MFPKALVLAFVFCVVTVPDPALAQPPSTDTTEMLVGSADYRIGPGDVLAIRVSGLREFDQSTHVSNSGRIRVPYVGVVFAAGMTAVELETEIAEKIRDHELVNEPTVRVRVAEYRARPVHVVGEVETPGQFVMTGEMSLLGLISRAGGLTASADGTAILYRRSTPRPSVSARMTAGPSPDAAVAPPVAEVTPNEPSSETQVIPVNLDGLQDGTRPELNIPLQGGDVLYVPRRQASTVYIIGDVKAPGAYGLPRRGQVTAAQAIIYAGGPTMTAKNRSGFLMRHDEMGVRQAIPIDFTAIIKGEKPDVPIQPDDIIFIPNSAAKTIAVGLLNLIPRLMQQMIIF